jgi:hypothetical protein
MTPTTMVVRGEFSCMDQPSAAEGPVLPGSLLESDHDVLRLVASGLEVRHQLLEQFLLDLDAAPDRPEDLD